MTLKERISSWFKKKPNKQCQVFVEFDNPETVIFADLEEELEDDDEEIVLYIDKDAVEGKIVEPNLEDMIAQFNQDVPDKKAIWGGKETKAFIKWKEDNNL